MLVLTMNEWMTVFTFADWHNIRNWIGIKIIFLSFYFAAAVI